MNDLSMATQLITEGETRRSLDIIRNYLEGNRSVIRVTTFDDLNKSIQMLSSQYSRLTNDFNLGMITIEERIRSENRISSGLISLIQKISNMNMRKMAESPKVNIAYNSEKVFGKQVQLRSIGWISQGLRLSSAICRMCGPTSMGTGFVISPLLLVTNHHVIGTPSEARDYICEFFFETNEIGLAKPVRNVKLNPDRYFATSKELDVTIVTLDSDPGHDVFRIPIFDHKLPQIGEKVSIIQHPSGGLKQIAMTNNEIVNINGYLLHYMTDTLPGSSGSPVFNDNWQLVAVHHAGGEMKKNLSNDTIFANEGTIWSAIIKDRVFSDLINFSE